MNAPLSNRVLTAFSADLQAAPRITLRGGNALDEYKVPEPFDPMLDVVSGDYFERYWWGVAYLDTSSWRHYLPQLIDYSLRRLHDRPVNPK
jgi:hypothetical protein